MTYFAEECSDDTGSQCSDTVEIQTAVAKETSKAYQIASDVISGHIPKNPFFICLMHQTHVSSRSYLEIPRAFAVETKIARKNAIKLLNEEGKKWRVSIFSERSKNSERFYMTEGWNAFRRENKLYVGNKFRFEFDANSGNLIMKKEIETSKLNVVSSGKRGRERPRKTLINNIPAKNEEPESDDFVELLEEFSTGKRNADYCDHDTIQISDDCTIDVSRNHDDDSTSEECSDDGTHVPLFFGRRNLPHKGANSVSMVMNGKKWLVRCIVRDRRADLTSGWRGFVQDNGLKVGDACIFEVANKSNKLVWNVLIFRN
ncbi:B3 domain-containing protein os03g0620400 [Phtheirospermum japonicum]|uniref:B3 domain-containing protein os03g0620400 n=1 Tax=Phtheirospermum japonicum TaxID=374723 RepID=A0A830B8E1_9LAMI|nr:B3 domain-containing protein os03g0620400 [Phtheirospermum japonicum]